MLLPAALRWDFLNPVERARRLAATAHPARTIV